MAAYPPGRPPNERDLQQSIAGQPVFLGVITSTSAARASNVTTAVPFNVKSSIASAGLQGTLAGRVLLLQPTAAGLILPSDDPTLSIVQQSATPSLVPPKAIPGVLIGANERVEITMGSNVPFLEFVAVTGTASLLVWEMQ